MARLYRGNSSPSLLVCPETDHLETLLVAVTKTIMVAGQPRHRDCIYADVLVDFLFRRPDGTVFGLGHRILCDVVGNAAPPQYFAPVRCDVHYRNCYFGSVCSRVNGSGL